MRVYFFALVLLGLTGTALRAQLDSDQFSLLTCGLLYLDDAGFRKELALTAQQRGKLTEERDKLLSAYGKATLFGVLQQAGKWSAQTDKELGSILNEKQAARWRQLVLQDATRQFGAYRTVRLPEVRAALKLKPAQESRLENGDDVLAVLDTDQKQRWNQMVGEPPTQPLTMSLPPPLVVSWPTPLDSDHLQALAIPSVQQELKIDDEQFNKLGLLRQQWLRGRQEIARSMPDRQPMLGKDLLARIDKGVNEVLSAEQQARLNQIARQLRLPRGIPLGIAIFFDEASQKSLNPSREQVTRIEKALEERRTMLRKAAENAETVADFDKALDAVNEQVAKTLDGLLDGGQKQRLAATFGKPFTGRRVPVDPETLQPDPVLASPVPLVLRVLPYLQQEKLTVELKLGAEQKKELAALEQTLADQVVSAASAATRKEREQKREEVYNSSLKTLQTILKPEQQTRLRELLIQCLEKVPPPRPEFRPQALERWPEMVKELDLSAAQLARLDDALHVKQVLTPDQWKKWQQMRGKLSPLVQNVGTEEIVIPLPARLNYLEEPAIVAELKLNDEQRRKLQVGIVRWRELAMRSTVWTPDERREKIPGLKKQIHDELFALLTTEQATRLEQLARQQWLKEEGLAGFFEIADTESELKLTAEQKQAVDELRRERELIDRVIRQQQPGFTQLSDELEFWSRLHSADRARLEKVLTEEQRKRLAELFGKPFEAPLTPYALKALATEDRETRLFGFAPPR